MRRQRRSLSLVCKATMSMIFFAYNIDMARMWHTPLQRLQNRMKKRPKIQHQEGKSYSHRRKSLNTYAKKNSSNICNNMTVVDVWKNYEWDLFCKSQHLLWKMQHPQKFSNIEELIFIDFRPRFLCEQKKVYRSMASESCSICFTTTYPENFAKQHVWNHPVICKGCYAQLRKCPFCRKCIRFPMYNLVDFRPRNLFQEIAFA